MLRSKGLTLHIALLLLTILTTSLAQSQQIIVSDVDVSNFPTIRARFHALDRDLKPVIGLSPSDFAVTEDGVTRPVVEVTDCRESRIVPLTVGIMVDTKYHIDLARAGTKRLASLLQMPPSELGITTMDAGVYIVQDLTKNKQKVIDKANGLQPAPGVDLQMMFYDPQAGGVPFVSGRPNRKVLVLISDLHCPMLNLDTTRFFADAAREGITVYSVLLHANDYTGLFRRIAAMTGGKVFQNVEKSEDIEDIFAEIGMEQYSTSCTVAWRSVEECRTAPRSVTIALPALGASAAFSYSIPLGSMPHLGVTPTGIFFDQDAQIALDKLPVTITALTGDVKVESLTSTHPRFRVIDYDGTPPPFTLRKGESRQLVIGFDKRDSEYVFGQIEIVTDFCPGTIYATGGSVHTTSPRTLKLTRPNGGEELLVGSDTVITWEGILPSDKVRIDYSTDAGATWNLIAPIASGLRRDWHVPNTPSRTCLARVRQITSPGDDSVVTIIAPFSVLDFFWDPTGSELALCGEGSPMLEFHDARSGVFTASLSSGVGIGAPAGAWNRNGRLVANGGYDEAAYVWDRAQKKLLYRLDHDDDPSAMNQRVVDVEWSPDGSLLATASWDFSARVWQISDGARMLKLDAGAACRQVAWNRQGNQLATRTLSGVKVFAIPSGTLLSTIPGSYNNMEWSPAGDRIATSPYFGADYRVHIWDPATGASLTQFGDGSEHLTNMTWSPDGIRIAATFANGQVQIWDVRDLANPTKITSITEPDYAYPENVAWSPDGSKLACSWYLPSKVFVALYDGWTGRPLTRLQLSPQVIHSLGRKMLWTSDGMRLAIGDSSVATIWSFDGSVVQEDQSDALWAIVASVPELVVKDVDMGTVQIGKGKDSLVKVALCNRGSVPLHVLGMDVTGGDREDFMIPSGAGDFTLAPGECRDITIEFMPTRAGGRRATVTVRMAGDTLADTIALRGVGVAPTLLVEAVDIDFGGVRVGDLKEMKVDVVLRNIGALPIDVTAAPQMGPDITSFSIVDGGAPFTVEPGGTHAMTLGFTPRSVGRTSGRITFEYNGAGSPAVARLYGRGLGGVISIPDDSAAPGEHLPIALVIDPQGPRVPKEPQRFRALVAVDQTLLAPDDPAAPGILDRGLRTLTVEGTWDGVHDTLAEIPMTALLGSSEKSRLELMGFDWIDAGDHPLGIETETRSGVFTLLGICREGGTRLYDERGVEAALKLSPNPAGSVAVVEYALAEDGVISIELYDLGGRSVGVLASGSEASGHHRLEVETGNLAAGTYLVMLRTPTAMVVGNLRVEH